MKIQDLSGLAVQIDSFRATYIVIKVSGDSIRFNIIDKKEFRLKKGTAGILYYFDEHPLLWDYNEPYATTYLNSQILDLEVFFRDVQNAIEQRVQGWRKWTDYVTKPAANLTLDQWMRNLKNGYGWLMEAPMSLTNSVCLYVIIME